MPGSNKAFSHTMGIPVTAALGGKSGLVLGVQAARGDDGKRSTMLKVGNATRAGKATRNGMPSHQAGFLGLHEIWG